MAFSPPKSIPGVTAVLLGLSTATGAAFRSYPDLVHRLTDLERLSVLPDPGERSAQLTSRDRASRYDYGTDTHQAWGANGDGNGFLGDNEDGGKIMAQMSGPGCIWRIWTAAAKTGSVKIFLDGSTVPAALESELCIADLSAGNHELLITMAGKNPASTGYYMGVDYLRLVPIATGLPAPSLAPSAVSFLGRITYREGGIRCQVSHEAKSALILDMRGNRLRALIPSGGEVIWDGRDMQGRLMRGGAYVLQAAAGPERRARSFVLIPWN